jgi:AraC-like DNA-binding protein
MQGSTISAFGEPNEYQAALQRESGFALVVTGRGKFQAQLTRMVLPRVHMLAGDEHLSRIAYITPRPHWVRVLLPVRSGSVLFWDGIACNAEEIVTHSDGQRLHERTEGASRWRAISLSMNELVRFGRAVIGKAFAVPSGACRWHPTAGALRRLIRLHDTVTRTRRVQPRVTASAAARGLKQQVFDALIECMQERMPDTGAVARRRRADIMSRFEDLISDTLPQSQSSSEICAVLGTSDRRLRSCCKVHLGMGPLQYLYLRRMQFTRQALQGADPRVTRVSEVAHRYGFCELGRFAVAYRQQFGESPSVTLRHKTYG